MTYIGPGTKEKRTAGSRLDSYCTYFACCTITDYIAQTGLEQYCDSGRGTKLSKSRVPSRHPRSKTASNLFIHQQAQHICSSAPLTNARHGGPHGITQQGKRFGVFGKVKSLQCICIVMMLTVHVIITIWPVHPACELVVTRYDNGLVDVSS